MDIDYSDLRIETSSYGINSQLSMLESLYQHRMMSKNGLSQLTLPNQCIEGKEEDDIDDDENYIMYDRTFKNVEMLQPFKSFTCDFGNGGIPLRVKSFKHINIINSTSNLPKYTNNFKRATYSQFCHVKQYLTAPEFNRNLLYNQKYDYIVESIISYMLEWDDISMELFIKIYPIYNKLCKLLMEFRQLDDGAYVYNYNGYPCIKVTFKILKNFFDENINQQTIKPSSSSSSSLPSASTFNWSILIEKSFIRHIEQVYNWLLNDEFDLEKINLLESPMNIPYKLRNINIEDLLQKQPKTFKFLTGQACCMKTSILEQLIHSGWNKMSRGDLGSFAAKNHNPAAIGNLHASLDFMLDQPHVIGDRGYIDNIIWYFIMYACDLKKSNVLVSNLFAFLNSNFNEPSIAQYISQRGLIFIDPYPEINRQRQLKRGICGDAHRARIYMYPIAQFITYYTVARLFGWKILCVPYDVNRQIDNDRFNRNINIVVNYFGEASKSNIPTCKYEKPANNFYISDEFAKSVGIFK